MNLSTTVFLLLYDATFEKLTRVWLIELIRARLFRFVANNNNNNNSTSLDKDLDWVVGNITSSVYRVGKGLCSVWERDIIYFIPGLPLVGLFPCSVSHKLGICVA